MTGSNVRALPAREAYRLWAPVYGAETVVSALEEDAVRQVTPPLRGRSLLDVGCGTGRRLPAARAGLVRCVGIDLVPEMLRAGHEDRRHSKVRRPLVAADVRALPLRDAAYDLVWCRLVLGHLRGLEGAYNELGRVSSSYARLVVTDFHPAAVEAGHRRTFRDARGHLLEAVHHPHAPEHHAEMAALGGWQLQSRLDVHVGPQVRGFYERAGLLDGYERQVGLPLVLLLVFDR